MLWLLFACTAPGGDKLPGDTSAVTDDSRDTTFGDSGRDSGADSPADSGSGGTGGTCGDGLCDPDEAAGTCCDDCGVCDDPGAFVFTTGYTDGGDGGGTTPGGMAAGYSSLPSGTYGSITFPMTVEVEPPADSDYFWAQQFYPEGGDGGYLGLQAHGLINGAWAGKIAIFSIWDAVGATPGADASCETFGGEGVGYSCRLAFDWQADTTYSFVLHQEAPATWTVEVYDPRAAVFLELGTIEVPGDWGGVSGDTVAFVEYFGDVGSCAETPYAVARVHAPRGDGSPATRMSAITYGDCASAATATCEGEVCD